MGSVQRCPLNERRRRASVVADCDLVQPPQAEPNLFLKRFVLTSHHAVVSEWASLVPVVDPTLHDQLVAALRPEAVEVVEGYSDAVVGWWIRSWPACTRLGLAKSVSWLPLLARTFGDASRSGTRLGT
jgi:hypothetical protein